MPNSNLIYLTLDEIASKYRDGTLKPSQLVESYYDAYKNRHQLNAYVEFFKEALEQAKVLDDEDIEQDNPLWGMAVAVKDNFAIKGHIQSNCSKFLEHYKAPYTSTAVKKLQSKKSLLLGRVSMDEFAMGGSGLLSAFGPVLNAVDSTRLAGGSSSGSAVSVASGMATFSLGSDTGGSVRVPASYNGICALKPSYGAISRYGVMTLASSLDVVGVLARTPVDIGYVFDALVGVDSNDESTITIKEKSNKVLDIKGLKIAGFATLLKGCKPSVEIAYNNVKEWLVSQGAIVEETDIDVIDVLLRTYYITVCSEASSSFARLDGIRYGEKITASTIDEVFLQSRSKYLGHELRRRVLLGNFFLKEENYNNYYNKALHIRDFLRTKMNELKASGVELFLVPGFAEAPKIGASEEDVYASDLLAVLANLYGGPAMAVPVMNGESGLNVSVQFMGTIGNDYEVIELGKTWFNYYKEHMK